MDRICPALFIADWAPQFLFILKSVPIVSSIWHLHFVLLHGIHLLFTLPLTSNLLQGSEPLEIVLSFIWNKLVRRGTKYLTFANSTC